MLQEGWRLLHSAIKNDPSDLQFLAHLQKSIEPPIYGTAVFYIRNKFGLTGRAVMRLHPSLFPLQLLVHHHSQNGPAISKREKGKLYKNFISFDAANTEELAQPYIAYTKALSLKMS